MKLAATILLLASLAFLSWAWTRSHERTVHWQSGSVLSPGDSTSAPVQQKPLTKLEISARDVLSERKDLLDHEQLEPSTKFTIQVVDEEGNRLPDAEVHVLDLGSTPNWKEVQEGLSGDLLVEDLAWSQGEVRRADSEGQLEIAWSEETCWLFGRHEERLGTLGFDSDSVLPARLVLVNDRALVCRVEDHRGNPMGAIPARFVIRNRGTVVLEGRSASQPDSGLVSWWGLERYTVMSDPRTEIEVSLDLPWLRIKPVVLAHLPEEPVVFNVPACGTLEIELRNAEGELVERNGWLQVYTTAHSERVRLNQGRAEVLGVGLNERYAVSAKFDHSSIEVDALGAGPREALESATIVIPWREVPSVVGRVVGENGEVLHNRDLIGRVATSSAPKNFLLKSDYQGRFSVALGDLATRAGKTLELSTGSHKTSLGGSALLPDVITGEFDIGDFVLRPKVVLVAGVVVNHAGEPESGMKVYITSDGTRMLEGLRGSEFTGKTDRTGRFEVRGYEPEQKALFLNSQGGSAGFSPVLFDVGDRELVVTCDRWGSVGANLVFPREWASSLRCRLRSDALPHMAPDSRQPDADGLVDWPVVFPGTYTFEVTSYYGGRVVEIPDVEVLPGPTTYDPRLQGLNLSDMLTTLELRMGTSDAMAAFFWARIESAEKRLADQGGVISFLANPQDGTDITVGARGYRSVLLENVRENRKVVLERGIPVAIRFSTDLSAAEFHTDLALSFTPAATKPELDRLSGLRVKVDSLNTRHAHFPAPGLYDVFWSRPKVRRPSSSQPQVTIEEEGGVLNLELTREEFDALVQ